MVDDFGNVVNPMLLAGQVHGGVGQGVGQALVENCVYDGASGQLLSGSFMDYAMPRANDVPAIEFAVNVVPCTTNPLGVKGAGEAGAIGAPPAVINAMVDALAELGVGSIDMPATPQSVWRAIRQAGATAMSAEHSGLCSKPRAWPRASAMAAILKVYATPFDVRHKADKSPVTLADEQAELLIIAALKKAAPDIPVIAEEEQAAVDGPAKLARRRASGWSIRSTAPRASSRGRTNSPSISGWWKAIGRCWAWWACR